uniref:Ovule protein n=1 Tax=Brugia timori TaxID=42155 RepID=A0A0R3RBU4_9BILA
LQRSFRACAIAASLSYRFSIFIGRPFDPNNTFRLNSVLRKFSPWDISSLHKFELFASSWTALLT